MGMQLGKGRSRRDRDRRATPRLRRMGHGAALEASAIAPQPGQEAGRQVDLRFIKVVLASRVLRRRIERHGDNPQAAGRRRLDSSQSRISPSYPRNRLLPGRLNNGGPKPALRRPRMVDSEHLQIAQIALSVRRAPGGRAVDAASSLVMFIASHVSAEARERASPPGGTEVCFDNASIQAVRVLRRCDGSAAILEHGSTGAREHGSTVLPDETRLERGSIRPPIKDDCDFIFTRELLRQQANLDHSCCAP
jgi:hypothetical protein